MPPRDARADDRVRIFTPLKEMLFAGHPTLGNCAAWLHCGGVPAEPGLARQDCAIGIVEVDASTEQLAFAAPATSVAPLPEAARARLISTLGIAPDRVLGAALLNNGPERQVLELDSAEDVLKVDATRTPYPAFQGVGLIGALAPGAPCRFEVRNASPSSGMVEDPITGSLNAAIAHWRVRSERWSAPVVIAPGTCIGREGRVDVRPEGARIRIGGDERILIDGQLAL